MMHPVILCPCRGVGFDASRYLFLALRRGHAGVRAAIPLEFVPVSMAMGYKSSLSEI